MTRSLPKKCVDCLNQGITTRRKLATDRNGKLVPGPRCVTHNRARRTQTRDTAWERRLIQTYNITPEQYWAIHAVQGGLCALCRRATGAKRKLSVDHDHACCPGPTSCGRCVRSLCCSTCNKMLGHIRDSLETAERIVNYLMHPPGKEVLAAWPNAR